MLSILAFLFASPHDAHQTGNLESVNDESALLQVSSEHVSAGNTLRTDHALAEIDTKHQRRRPVPMDAFRGTVPKLAGFSKWAGYSMMFDAGSSGTRLFVYYPNMSLCVELSKGNPLTACLDDPCQAGPPLQEMLKEAQAKIPPALWSLSPVWLRATAGIRLAPVEKSLPVMDCINLYFANASKTVFQWRDAAMISGDMEAVYGSVSINEHFQDSYDYLGTLELGGASMQIAFKPMAPIRDYEFHYYGERGELHAIYAKSYMRFGDAQAINRAESLVAAQYMGVGGLPPVIPHPCFLEGDSWNSTVKLQSADDHTVPTEVNVTFVGTGDSSGCQEVTKQLTGRDDECLLTPCAMMGVYQPLLSGKWIAYESFFYTAEGLSLMNGAKSRIVEPIEFADASRTYCQQAAELVRSKSEKDWYFNRKYCFNGWWVYAMLRSMYFEDHSRNITFLGPGISWTRGALLYLTVLMPETI